MPRLKKQTHEQIAMKSKLRQRKTRYNWVMNYSDDDEQRLVEAEDLKNNAQLYLSPFTPEWTENKDDSQYTESANNSQNQGEHSSPLRGDRLNDCVGSADSVNDDNESLSKGNAGASAGNGDSTGQHIKEEPDVDNQEDFLEKGDSDSKNDEMSSDIKKEMDPDAEAKDDLDEMSGIEESMPPPADKPLGETLNAAGGDIDEENFVVDCDPMIVANPGASAEPNKSISSDDSSYSSSSTQFFTDVLKNNEIFYNQMSTSPSTFDDAELARVLQEHYDKFMTVNDENYEKRKRAAAIQRRRRKRMLDKMTEEELKEYRKKQTEACRLRRQRRFERMSDEERKRDRMLKNALCLARRHRREAMMSEEERKARKAAAAAAQREKRKRKRENMSDEELKAHKAEVAAIWRMRRQLRYMRMSEDERRAERAKAAEAKRISRQRQKEEEQTDHQYRPPTPTKKPRRKRGRPRLYRKLSETQEKDGNDGGDGDSEVTAESLISQILKQTQHIAALESQEGDGDAGAPMSGVSRDDNSYNDETYLLPHERDMETPPKVTNETYLLPHEIPEKEANKNQQSLQAKERNQEAYLLPHERQEPRYNVGNHPNTTIEKNQENCPYPKENPGQQNPGSNQHSNNTQETQQEMEDQHMKEVPEVKQESCALPQKLAGHQLGTFPNPNVRQDTEEYSQSHIQGNREHLGMPHIYPQYNIGESNHPRQFYGNEGRVGDPMEATKHLQQRIHPSDHLIPPPPPHYHPSAIPYDSRAAALHQYHLSNLQGMSHPGHLPPPYHHHYHSENQDNQSAALQQYIHSRNYMNTLY